MGKISLVLVTGLICIFLTSQASEQTKTPKDNGSTSTTDGATGDSNPGLRNVKIDGYVKEDNYVTFNSSHLDPTKDQYRYQTYSLACETGEGFNDWQNISQNQLAMRIPAHPYTNVTLQIRDQTTGRTIGTNSAVTPAKEPEVRVTSLHCTHKYCKATMDNDCMKYNGNNVTVQLTLQPSSEKLKNPLVGVVSDATSVTIGLTDLDLLPFTNYTVTAKVANNAGAATDSSLTKEAVFLTRPKKPGRVSNLTVTHATPSSLHVVWTAPDDDPPKGKLTQYNLEWTNPSVSTASKSEVFNESVTSFNITGLEPNTNYVIKISARNAGTNGYGKARSVTSTTTMEQEKSDRKKTGTNLGSDGEKTGTNLGSDGEKTGTNLGSDGKKTGTKESDGKQTGTKASDGQGTGTKRKDEEGTGTDESDGKTTLHFSWTELRSHSNESHHYKVIYSHGDETAENTTPYTHITLDGLTPGKKYTLKVQECSEARSCEPLTMDERWTKPEEPRVSVKTDLQTTTTTTLTIQLPVLKNPPGMHWVLLKKYSGKFNEDTVKKDAREMVQTKRELEKQTLAKRRKRRSANTDLRIVAKVEVVDGQKRNDTVMVGKDRNGEDGLEDDTQQGPLEPGTEYVVVIVTETKAGPHSEFKACQPRIMKTKPRPQEYHILGMIGGMCAAAVVLIFLFVLLVRICSRKPRKELPEAGYSNPVEKEENPVFGSIQPAAPVIMTKKDSQKSVILPLENKWKPEEGPEEDLYANINQQVSGKELESYLPRAIHASETKLEFNSVPFFIPGKTSSGSFIPENMSKNRYKNKISYDDTRVELPLYQNIPHSDYINANFVKDPSGHAAFIATQGPKDNNADTIGAFWRMIWHTECRLILMVANLVEGGKVKVAQYWPEKEPLVKEGVQVTLTSVQVLMDYAVRTFTVAVNGKTRTVKQYHYMAWPDHGVPQTAYGLGYMLKAIIKDYAEEPHGPITVHCSAGIGRTGTIILTLFLLRQLRAFKAIDTKKALFTLREGRGRLVENAEQYIFVHKLLYDVLFGMRTTHSCQSFVQKVATLLSSTDPDGKLVLQKEFENMKKLPKDLTFKHGSNPECAHLNRNHNILPADQRMIFVQMFGRGQDSQYVNLIRVHGFDRKDAYLAGEHPQLHSLAKMWQLVYDNNISVWLLLQEFPHNDQSYPNVVIETSAVPKNMSLEISQPIHLKNFTEYTATLSVQERDCQRNHKCTLLMLKGWPHTAKLPSSPLPLLWAIEKAESLQLPQTPLLFTCSDGVTACGVMATLLLAVCRAKLTQEVDLHRSAVSVQYDRPQFLTDLAQYQFLFRAMEAFLNENNHYGNFA